MEFTREQYENLPARDVNRFKEFVLKRFCDYTSFTTVKAGRGYVGDPRTTELGVVEHPIDAHGWSGWKVDDGSLFNDEDYLVVYHYLQDERASTMYSKFVKVPKAFVFGEMEQDKDYQLYLELKARFE